MPSPSKMIVLVGQDLIGDAFLKIPFLFALKNAYPHHLVTWIATHGRTAFAGPLRQATHHLIHTTIEHCPVGIKTVAEKELFPLQEADLVIDTRSGIGQTWRTRRQLRPHCFVSATGHFLLSDRKPASFPFSRKPAHLTDRLLRLVFVAAGKDTDITGTLSIPDDAFRQAEALLPFLPSPRAYIGLVPGAGDRRKCWPLPSFVAIAKTIIEQKNVPVFFLGPDEEAWLTPLRAQLPEALFPEQEALKMAPSTKGWPLVMALGQKLALAITNDCGTSHMLGAAQTPLVGLFGPTRAEKFMPRVKPSMSLQAQDFGQDQMDAIPIHAVQEKMQELLTSVQSRS